MSQKKEIILAALFKRNKLSLLIASALLFTQAQVLADDEGNRSILSLLRVKK